MKTIKPRTTAPKAGNKFYVNIADGGISPYKGNPKMKCHSKKLSALPNCFSYTIGALNEMLGYDNFHYTFTGNAEDIYVQAKSKGLKTGKEPRLGAIICWKSGAVSNASDNCGHCAIVSEVYSDGSILTSESGWSCDKNFFTTKRVKGSDGNWGMPKAYWQFQGFVYIPDVENVITNVAPLEVDGIFGPETMKYTERRFRIKEDGAKTYNTSTTAALQDFLMMPIKKCTGELDAATIKRLQAWLQRKKFYTGKLNGNLDVDTIKAWQSYLNAYFTK